MFTILTASNSLRLTRWTPYFAGTLLAIYITFEAPFSGMSMNPARSVASAMYANDWSGMWYYLIGPPLGMLLRGGGVSQPGVLRQTQSHGRRCLHLSLPFWGDGRLTRPGLHCYTLLGCAR